MYSSPFLDECRVTCEFGRKGSWQAGYHTGLDLVCENRTVRAVASGTVAVADYHSAYGNRIIIRQDDGNSTLYGHLSVRRVTAGDRVWQGQEIGVEGATGNATGMHLHVEVHKGDWRYPPKSDTPAEWLVDPAQVIDLGDTEPRQSPAPEYPGKNFFGPGKRNEYITLLGQRLVAKGYGSYYKIGPGPSWSNADRLNCQAFQLAQGWTGPDADGYPGPETWKRLFL